MIYLSQSLSQFSQFREAGLSQYIFRNNWPYLPYIIVFVPRFVSINLWSKSATYARWIWPTTLLLLITIDDVISSLSILSVLPHFLCHLTLHGRIYLRRLFPIFHTIVLCLYYGLENGLKNRFHPLIHIYTHSIRTCDMNRKLNGPVTAYGQDWHSS